MTDIPPVGTLVRAHSRHTMQYTPDPGGISGTAVYRVTAVRGDRVYVSRVSGPMKPDGIEGLWNQWYRLGDERVVVEMGNDEA